MTLEGKGLPLRHSLKLDEVIASTVRGQQCTCVLEILVHSLLADDLVSLAILHENGVTLTQREPPVRISQPAAPITPRVHGPLDEWLVPSSIGSVHDLDLEDDDF